MSMCVAIMARALERLTELMIFIKVFNIHKKKIHMMLILANIYKKVNFSLNLQLDIHPMIPHV